MKELTVAISTVVVSVLMAMSVQAAEIYNKGGNRLDLYGKVNAKHYFSPNDVDGGDTTYVRLNFKSETQINDQLTGFGQWEYEFKGNRAKSQGSSKDKTRLAFAGLKFGDYDSIDYGRNCGVAYDIGAWTNALSESGGDTQTRTNVFMTGRAIGVATYHNNDSFGLVDGLNFVVQYRGKDDRIDVTEANGDGSGFFTAYGYEGFGVGATYVKSDRTNDQVIYGNDNLNASDQNVGVWAAGLKYDTNDTYLATTCSETRNMTAFSSNYIANKAQNFEVVAQYQLDFGLRPSVAYLQFKGKDLSMWGDQDLVEYINIGAIYYFNKNMSTFVDYRVNLVDKSDFTKASGVVTDDIVAVGLVYQFQSDYSKICCRKLCLPNI